MGGGVKCVGTGQNNPHWLRDEKCIITRKIYRHKHWLRDESRIPTKTNKKRKHCTSNSRDVCFHFISTKKIQSECLPSQKDSLVRRHNHKPKYNSYLPPCILPTNHKPPRHKPLKEKPSEASCRCVIGGYKNKYPDPTAEYIILPNQSTRFIYSSFKFGHRLNISKFRSKN